MDSAQESVKDDVGSKKVLTDEQVQDRRDKFKKWYAENSDELSAARRKSYRSDPKYKKRVSDSVKRYRARKKKERKELIKQGVIVLADKKGARSHTVEHNGNTYEAWTTSRFLVITGRSVPTLNNWVRKGLLPETPLRSDRGDRLYTDDMLNAVLGAIERRRVVSLRDKTFYEEVLRDWVSLGLEVES